MSVQYICARECGGRSLTSHILATTLRVCYGIFSEKKEKLLKVTAATYAKKVQSILYAYSYVATYIHTLCSYICTTSNLLRLQYFLRDTM